MLQKYLFIEGMKKQNYIFLLIVNAIFLYISSLAIAHMYEKNK
jgi:hypothetical protein